MPATKYKLFSAQAEGGKPPCAFFASPKGCRNGDSCKFSHELPALSRPGQDSMPSAAESGSMVSSESDDERKVVSVDDDSPFQPSTAVSANAETSGNKKKARRGNKTTTEPFANPRKKAKTHEVAPNTTSPQPSHKNKSAAESTPRKDKQQQPQLPPASTATTLVAAPPDFRSLNLPIAPFSGPSSSSALSTVVKSDPKTKSASVQTTKASGPTTTDSPKDSPKAAIKAAPEPKPKELPLPTSNPAASKWLGMVQATHGHPRFNPLYNFEKCQAIDDEIGCGRRATWIRAKPYGGWSSSLPQAVAIDCEMCETQDPVTGKCDPRALCRISVVDAETEQVLLDTLVKPQWPVRDHRAWINGITAEHLENVQFTLRHAQAFLLALCSEETVVLGHSVHNDLAALRWEHQCVADSALLFRAEDSPTATVSLKDLARMILGTTMPEVHDSVNDAKAALECLKYYLKMDGKVEGIVRSNGGKSATYNQLFIHRIPSRGCDKSHLSKMFLLHSDVQPTEVQDIEFVGGMGKTQAVFRTKRHADLAFEMLEGKSEPDASGKLQKKVFLKDGSYIRVRKMGYEKDKKINNPASNHEA